MWSRVNLLRWIWPLMLFGLMIACLNADPLEPGEPAAYDRSIDFSGYSWWVKDALQGGSPGPNYFSASKRNVWVDDSGRLHLRIWNNKGRWYCSEVINRKPLGYGTYLIQLATTPGELDPNVIAGFFTWDETSVPDGLGGEYYRELDIEFSRWGDPAASVGQYVVQPADRAGNMHRFTVPIAGSVSTHVLDWHANKVRFRSFVGAVDSTSLATTEEVPFADWIYTEQIPSPGQAKFRINFYLFQGRVPTDNRDQELIVASFQYIQDETDERSTKR